MPRVSTLKPGFPGDGRLTCSKIRKFGGNLQTAASPADEPSIPSKSTHRLPGKDFVKYRLKGTLNNFDLIQPARPAACNMCCRKDIENIGKYSPVKRRFGMLANGNYYSILNARTRDEDHRYRSLAKILIRIKHSRRKFLVLTCKLLIRKRLAIQHVSHLAIRQ